MTDQERSEQVTELLEQADTLLSEMDSNANPTIETIRERLGDAKRYIGNIDFNDDGDIDEDDDFDDDEEAEEDDDFELPEIPEFGDEDDK
jgi:hypothetical protein